MAGLAFLNGSVIVPWGSFSDFGVYHGWLMAFDGGTLALQAVFNPTPQAQPIDDALGPADHGGGGHSGKAARVRRSIPLETSI